MEVEEEEEGIVNLGNFPSVFFASLPFFSKLLESFGSHILKIVDTHDVFSDRHLRYLSHNQRPSWFSLL